MTIPSTTTSPSHAEHLDDVYTRKVGGETYTYTLDYTPGARVTWQAKVSKDGDLKGKPGGVLSDNTLDGSALRQNLITLVELAIENMMGIDE